MPGWLRSERRRCEGYPDARAAVWGEDLGGGGAAVRVVVIVVVAGYDNVLAGGLRKQAALNHDLKMLIFQLIRCIL